MKIHVLSLFPEMFIGVLGSSILKKAQERNIVFIEIVNFRDFANNNHNSVDDYPYGGGNGMVLKPEPIFNAIESIKGYQKARRILLTPQGETFTQRKAEELNKEEHLIFICGHYEGFDERVRENLITDEISIGDYILTGGEIASMAIIDSVVRLLPGVLGNEQSAKTDSFSSNFLEYPQYTRPETFRGLNVPEVLLSGHHKNIENWRKKESLRRTLIKRPDLLNNTSLSDEDIDLLKEIKKELNL